ncbi:MAG: hypothetical protein QNL04_01035 [SAR324 cluster bacterium]|nr:hypothetical protein [SAR324 cluster bacterium]
MRDIVTMRNNNLYNKLLRSTLGLSICFTSLFLIISCENPKEELKAGAVEKQKVVVKKIEPQMAPLPAPPEPPKWEPEEEKPRSPEQEVLLKDLQASDYCKIANAPEDYSKPEFDLSTFVIEAKEWEIALKKGLKAYIILKKRNPDIPMQVYVDGKWQEFSYYDLTVHYKKLWQEVCNSGKLNLPELWHAADLIQRFAGEVDEAMHWNQYKQFISNAPRNLPATISQELPYDLKLDHRVFHKLAAISTKKSDLEFFALKKLFEPGDQKNQAFTVCNNISIKNVDVLHEFDRLSRGPLHPVYRENLKRNKVRIEAYYDLNYSFFDNMVCYCKDRYPDPKAQLIALRKYYFEQRIQWVEPPAKKWFGFQSLIKNDLSKIKFIPFDNFTNHTATKKCHNTVIFGLREKILDNEVFLLSN